MLKKNLQHRPFMVPVEACIHPLVLWFQTFENLFNQNKTTRSFFKGFVILHGQQSQLICKNQLVEKIFF
jgi:hypothetical protein